MRADLVAGVTVALLAIPQALAYAELAGLPPHAGIFAVAAATIAAAFFASSPHIQTGPVVTTSLLTLGVLIHLEPGGPEGLLAAAGLLAIIVGVARVLIGVLKLGAVAHLLPQPVILAFISGAAVLIMVSQVPAALGMTPPDGGMLVRAAGALASPASWRIDGMILATLTVLAILLCARFFPRFPGALVVMILGIGYSVLFAYDGPTVGELPRGMPLPTLDFPFEHLPSLVLGGLVIALVGFSEAASIARTYAIMDRRRWSADQEFISQGAANLASGFFGGMPVGASFSRSALGRLAGAKTRWSGLFTGLTVLAIIPVVFLLEPLPKATLAGVMIASVLKLSRLRELVHLREFSRPQALIAWITFFLTLALAPRIDYALLIGIGLALAHHLRREQRVLVDVWVEEDALHLRPKGVLWFGSAPIVEEMLNEGLEKYPDAGELILHLGGLGRIDLSAAMMLGRLMTDARSAGFRVRWVDLPPMAQSWAVRVWGIENEEEEQEPPPPLALASGSETKDGN